MKSIDSNRWDKDDDNVKKILVHCYEEQSGETIPLPLNEIAVDECKDNGYHTVTLRPAKGLIYDLWDIDDETVDSIVNRYLLALVVERL